MPLNQDAQTIEAFPEFGNARLGHHVALLPEHSKARIAAEAKFKREERAKAMAAQMEHQELRDQRDDLDRRRGQLERHKRYGQMFTEKDEEELSRLNSERERIAKRLRSASPAQPVVKLPKAERDRNAFLFDFAPTWQERLSSCDELTTFVPCRAELPKIAKGKSLLDALSEGRQKQDDVIAEIVALWKRPLDRATSLPRILSDLDRYASGGDLNIIPACSFKERNLGGRRTQGHVIFPEDQSSSGSVQRGGSLLATVFRKEIEAYLTAKLDDRLKDDPGISIPDREREEKKLCTRLLELHRVEARICAELEAQEIPYERKPLHPLAWLEVDYGERLTRPNTSLALPDTLSAPVGSLGGVPLTADEAAGWTTPHSD